MRSILFCLVLVLTLSSQINAQFEFGMKMGLYSTDLVSETIPILQGEQQQINLLLQGAQYGVHFGVYSRITLAGLFIEPSVIFNSTSAVYSLEQYNEGEFFSQVKTETFHNIDIPVMVGIKFFMFRLFAGPVAHIHLDRTRDLLDISGLQHRLRSATYGFQAGAGVNIWKLRFTTSYEGNLPFAGNSILIAGSEYALSHNPSRLIFAMGIKF